MKFLIIAVLLALSVSCTKNEFIPAIPIEPVVGTPIVLKIQNHNEDSTIYVGFFLQDLQVSEIGNYKITGTESYNGKNPIIWQTTSLGVVQVDYVITKHPAVFKVYDKNNTFLNKFIVQIPVGYRIGHF